MKARRRDVLIESIRLMMATPVIETGEGVVHLEQLIVKAFEQSLVGGGFMLLLWYVLHKQDKQLSMFSSQMKETTDVLREISERLLILESKDKYKQNDK